MAASSTSFKDFLTDDDVNDITADETGTIFHIKTEAGFNKLGEYDGEFDPSWTFYLDSNITLNSSPNIGPFQSTFDGQGHTISVASNSITLFGSGTPVIQNVNIEGDNFCLLRGSGTIQNVNVTMSSLEFDGFLCMAFIWCDSNKTCNLSHVSINVASCTGMGCFILLNQGSIVNCYDVEINMEEYTPGCVNSSGMILSYCLIGGASIIPGVISTALNMNSCRINLNKVNVNAQAFLLFNASSYNISNSSFNINFNYSYIQGFATIFYLGGEFRCAESQFNIKGTETSYNFSCHLLYEGDSNQLDYRKTFYDTAIIWSDISSLGFDGKSNHYYSGFYMARGRTTTIIDPNFTSYKWCIDTHLNDGLPQLRRFVSIGDFMEQCDMAAWAREKMAS